MGAKKIVIATAAAAFIYHRFKRTLSSLDYWLAGMRLGCDPAIIKAIAYIESGGKGWTDKGVIKTRLENQFLPRYQAESGKAAKYFITFAAAYDYDKRSAILSTSFGIFQIMGFNHKLVGYSTPETFYLGMRSGAVAQLNAFVKFVKARKLEKYLRDKNWAAFAYYYNGPAYARNNYDTKLQQYYNKFK
jgi:hypothetical protein